VSLLPEHGTAAYEFQELKRRVEKLERSDRSHATSIGAGGLRIRDGGVIRSDDFDGDVAAGNAGSQGWALGGGRAVLAELVLADGVIGTDALAEPVAFGGAGNSQLGFSISTTPAMYATGSIAVPSWADQVLVFCSVNASVRNPRTSIDFAYLRAVIDGVGGGEQFTRYDPDWWANINATAQRIITNPGSSIPVAARMRTEDGAWSASAGNIVNMEAVAIFRRMP
jgi:hypothetical protein